MSGSQQIDRGMSNEAAEWENWSRHGWIERSLGSTYTVRLNSAASVWYYRPGGPATVYAGRSFYSFPTVGLTVLAAELHLYLRSVTWESGKDKIDVYVYTAKDEIDYPQLGSDGAQAEYVGFFTGAPTYLGSITSNEAVAGSWHTFSVPLAAISAGGNTDVMLMPSTETSSTHGGRYYFGTASAPTEPFLRMTIVPLREAERTAEVEAEANTVTAAAGEAVKASEAGVAEMVAASGGGVRSAALARTVRLASASTIDVGAASGTAVRQATLGTATKPASDATRIVIAPDGDATEAAEAGTREVVGV